MRISLPLRSMLIVKLLLIALVIAMIAAPLTLPEGSVTELDGKIGSVDNWDDIGELPWPQMVVYFIGDVNCHQQADRSFYLNGNQIPVCARDLGLFAGAAIGLGIYMIMRKQVPWLLLALLLAPMALDGGLQTISSYESDNTVRTITGMVAGLAIGWAIGILMDRFFRTNDALEKAPEGDGQS
ncbi:MAG: DUF2085 domain-containing protein [Methanomassiliicoccales archaeon]|nr:DUF2085 domain-containing protein [Methanomassiliicoccales archaeon]